MKKRFYIILLFLVVWTTSPVTRVQAQAMPGGSMDFINPAIKKVQIRFKLVNNLIIIPLIINGSDTLRFILDTGIENTIISELSLGDTLSLRYTRVTPITGLGVGKPLDAIVSTGNIFSLPGIRGTGQTVFVLLQNIFDLSNVLGTRVHGLIGYRIFRHFIVRIDYDRNIITLYDPDTYRYKLRRHDAVLPLTFRNSKPYLRATVVNQEGEKIDVRLLLDTGLSFGLWLIPGSTPGISIPPHSVKAYLGTGLNGRINGRLARIPEFSLGPYSFEDPIVGFPDTLSFIPDRYNDLRNGTLGSGILKRFNVIIDYHNKNIILHPNKFFREPFYANNAGIQITSPIPGFRYYIISYLRHNSPGALAGLKKGDKLEKINGKSVSNMSMDEIYRIFMKKPGHLVRMTVIRNGMKFETRFYLEKFL
jgi:hypothetical protein